MALVAESSGLGFPIATIIDFAKKMVLSIGDETWGFRSDHLSWLREIYRTWSAEAAGGERIFVLGEQNFAHCALNQLPAVLLLKGCTSAAGARFVATHEPLGSIGALFDRSDWRSERVPEYALEGLNRPGMLFVPCGAYRIRKALCDLLLQRSRETLGSEAREVMAKVPPHASCLWMSVRTVNRTPSNQTDLLGHLGRCFLSTVADGHIIIDGLSLPVDLEIGSSAVSPVYSERWFRDIVASDLAAALTVRELLGEGNESSAGRGAPNYRTPILLANLASFYFCHHGTVQHKIGWFHSTPGVVHANKGILEHSPGSWVAERSEVAIAPTYLPPGMVTDDPTPPVDHPMLRALRHENYTVDIENTVAFVVELLTRDLQ